MLDNSIIKKLNSLILPDSNIGNLIPISDFFNINKDYENDQDSSILDNNSIKEFNSNDSSIDDNDEYSDGNDEFEDNDSENKNIDESNEKDKNIYNNISDNKDLCYNIQQLLNNLNIDDWFIWILNN